MKTFYVVAKRYFNDGQGHTVRTMSIQRKCTGLSTTVLDDLREVVDAKMQDDNPEITYDDTCMITFIHELED